MIKDIEAEIEAWHEKNFSDIEATDMLIGVMEELGELAHANLKGRVLGKDMLAEEQDAIGDIMVFLIGYCNYRGWLLSEILPKVWAEVKQRDYTVEQGTGNIEVEKDAIADLGQDLKLVKTQCGHCYGQELKPKKFLGDQCPRCNCIMNLRKGAET